MIAYIVKRLKEVSTWQGLIAALTILGVHITPEQSAAFVQAGLSAFAAISVLLPQYFGSKDASK